MDVGKELDGTTPPSVFIGSWNYPKVYAGPMITPVEGDTTIMDTPESWIANQKTQEDIIRYRLNLVRGKQLVGVKDLENGLVEKLQEISLSSNSIDSEAEFHGKPRGVSFSDHHPPHGPSAVIEKFDIESVRWDRDLEKVYYDTDLLAKEAVLNLHQEDVPFSQSKRPFQWEPWGLGNAVGWSLPGGPLQLVIAP